MDKNKHKNVWKTARLTLAVMMAIPFMLALAMPTASAVVGEEWAVQSSNGQGLFIVGLIGLITLMAIQYGAGYEITSSMIGAILVAAVAMMMIIPATLGAIVVLLEEEPEEEPPVTPPTGIRWMVDLDPDGDVDGSTYPAGLFTDVDTAIGGTTGEWETANDNPLVNDQTNKVTASVHVDTDVAYVGPDWESPLWMEPNGIFIEGALIKLLDGPKSSAGAIEVQQYWGRIDRIDYITPSPRDNDSADPVDPIYTDGNFIHHIGWQDENNNWLQACSEYQGVPLPSGASCGAVPLGSDDTTGDAIKAVASGGIRLFWIWEDRGPFSWAAQDGDTWSLTFSIGSEGDWHTYVFTAYYLEDATNNA